MNGSDEGVPFWLVVLVAAAAVFAVVALVAVFASRGVAPVALPPTPAPSLYDPIQQAIIAYHARHGVLPGDLDVGRADSPDARTASRPSAPPGPAADLSITARWLEPLDADTDAVRDLALALTIANDGPDTATGVQVEVVDDATGATLGLVPAPSVIRARRAVQLITTVKGRLSRGLVVHVYAAVPDPHPADNVARPAFPPPTSRPAHTP